MAESIHEIQGIIKGEADHIFQAGKKLALERHSQLKSMLDKGQEPFIKVFHPDVMTVFTLRLNKEEPSKIEVTW